ncbi:MAG: hypothetical protein GTO03_05690 [Planctomycetales bacterium]|nr:hypothetical protein [Planctomycetales bacterium]
MPSEWDEPDGDDDAEDGYDDEGLDADTVPCPQCGADVYEDAPQCPACGNYITYHHQLAPLWWWTAVVILALIALAIWSSLRNLP